MFLSTPHRRRLAWIALVAMWAFALLPTLSRALSVADAAGNWAEICTAEGARTVALNGDDGQPRDLAKPLMDHCAFCGFSADGAAPLPGSAARAALPITSDEQPPRLFLHAPRPLHAWHGAQPRGPPVRA